MVKKGILLNENNDLSIINKGFVIGNSEMQEVSLILQANQGEFKHVPVLGPNLIQNTKVNISRLDVEQRVRIALGLDGKDYNEIKNNIKW